MDEEYSYFDIIYSFFNQYIFNEAKTNIGDLRTYFSTNPATSKNKYIDSLLDIIQQYDLANITLPTFQGLLLKTGKSAQESQAIMNKIVEFKQMTKDQIEPARKYIRDFVATVHINHANSIFRNSPSEYLNYLKGVDIKSSSTDYLNSSSFNKLDINSIVADTNSACISSSFDFINNSFSEGAFKPGDIVVVSMPPSVGKSLMAETEALHMAINLKVPVNLLVMGDLDMSSLFLRLAAIYTGLPFSEARQNLAGIYDDMKKVIGDRLDIIIAPAGEINARDYVDYILNSPKKYKAVFMDYDENFSIDYSNSGMYSEFGSQYGQFTRLKDAGIISYVLCQPKQGTWRSTENDVIELQDLGTSSRKGHIADVVITRTRAVGDINGFGVFYIAKNRHGQNVKAYSVRLNNGRFKIIPREVYESLKGREGYHPFTEAEVDQAIRSLANVKQAIQNATTNKMMQNNMRGPNPFQKP